MPLHLAESPVEAPQNPEFVLSRRALLAMGAGAVIAGTRARFGSASALADEPRQKKVLDEHELHTLIDREWDKQNPVYERIAKIGMQEHYDSLPDKDDVFLKDAEIKEANGVCSCCSDEGIRKYTDKDSGKRMMLIRTPGSGILHALSRPDKNPFAPEFIEGIAKEQLELGVTVFTSHIGCGAGLAVFNAYLLSLRMQGRADQAGRLEKRGLDAFVRDWAEAISKRMRAMAKEQSIKHADSIHTDFIDHLDRNSAFHSARLFDLVDDDRFNADCSLPPAFVEHAGTNNTEQGITDITTLSDIALGEDGFGPHFSKNPEEQFILCAIARTQQRLNILMARAEKAHGKFKPGIREKIRVEGIMAS